MARKIEILLRKDEDDPRLLFFHVSPQTKKIDNLYILELKSSITESYWKASKIIPGYEVNHYLRMDIWAAEHLSPLSLPKSLVNKKNKQWKERIRLAWKASRLLDVLHKHGFRACHEFSDKFVCSLTCTIKMQEVLC